MRYAPQRCRAHREKSCEQWKSHARICRVAVDQNNGCERNGRRKSTARSWRVGSGGVEFWQGRCEMERPGIFRISRRKKKMNAQCQSPVGRWAFYTVICTALCGTLTQGNASWLAAVRSWFGLADGIVARSAARGKGQHGTNRDISGFSAVNREQIACGLRRSSGHTRIRRLEGCTV